MAEMTRAEKVAECKRLKTAIRNTNSKKLKSDYGKQLKRLQKSLLYTDD